MSQETNHTKESTTAISDSSIVLAEISKTTVCQNCQSTLITRGLTPGQQIRCGCCSNLSRFGQIENVATDRLAWRSFWLGLSSLLLLFFTGVPAMYYGIRSLLRMRFVRPKTSDRAAAVAGTMLGGCMGIVGVFLAFILLVIALAIMSVENTNDPEQVATATGQHFTADFPDDLLGTRSRAVFRSQFFFDFGDALKRSDRTKALRLSHQSAAIPMNRSTVISALRNANMSFSAVEKKELAEMLQWTIDGEEIDISKTVFTLEVHEEYGNPDAEESQKRSGKTKMLTIHRYLGVVTRDSGLYGIAMVISPKYSGWDDERVNTFFESIKIVN